MIYRFAGCVLDTERVVLLRDGTPVHVEPQVFSLLELLLERRGTVVRKEELLDSIWGTRFVSESALTSRIRSARQAVGDDGTAQHVIRTVHGRGYELVALVDGPFGDPTDADPTGAGPERPSRLPAAVVPLIGRAELLADLEAAVGHRRLVTLTGTGGVGKTALGFELARRVEHRFPDGAYAVELVTVVDEGATLAAFATAVDVNTRQQASIDEAVIDVLRARRALLLLDNCEHVIEPLAALVHRILRAAPGITIVATSREPLAVASEDVWTVPPLAVSDADLDPEAVGRLPAVALFVERAGRAGAPSPSTGVRPRRCWRSAAASTGSRWPSSWRRPEPGRSTSTRSPAGSTSASGSCGPCGGAPIPATAPWRTPSAGATTSWLRPSGTCSPTSPCSPAPSTWRQWSGCAGTRMTSRARTPPTRMSSTTWPA